MATIAPHPAVEVRSYAAFAGNDVSAITSAVKLAETDKQLFTLQQRHFVVGGQHLVLEQNPQIAISIGRFDEFEIVGWNIRLQYGKQDQIGRALVRKFLFLFGKAERLELTEGEEAEWAGIAKRVDYKRFSVDRSPFRYVEGTLVLRDAKGSKIQWHDGTTERVSDPLATAFRVLEPGERFKGFGKFGEGNVLTSIMTVSPLPPVSEETTEAAWQAWPSNA
jgi:hypothetical protein